MHVHFTVELDMACKWALCFRLDGKLGLNSFDTVDDFIWHLIKVNYLVVMEQIHMLENGSGGIEGHVF